ncbi:MAG: hypothetical protein ACP5G4_07570 [bacterium]
MRKLLAILLIFAASAFAIGLGGYYEIQTRFAEDGTWQLFEPSHRFELRLNASPWQDTEAFAKFFAELSRTQDNDPERQFHEYTLLEGHLKYRWPKHFEVLAFAKENRYWFSQGLFEVVTADRLSGDTQALRMDFWGLGPVSGLAYYNDWSGASGGEDALVGRVNAPLWGDRIRLGATAARKDWGETTSDYNAVVGGDIGFALGRIVPPLRPLGNIDITAQIAASRVPAEPEDPEDIIWAMEMRQLKLKDFELQARYHDYGADFRSYLSNQFDYDQSFNERGYYLRGVYFFPMKAINLSGSYSRTTAPQNRLQRVSESNPERDYHEAYGEVYIEWVNNIKSKAYYKYYRGWDPTYESDREYPTLFGEISLENSLAKVRAQVRAKDIGTPYQVIATGAEINVNLSDNLKLYARAVNAEERYESRQTAFVQLRYERFQPAEVFLEFGNPGDSDNDLTNDDDFVNEAASHGVNKQIKLFVKVYF